MPFVFVLMLIFSVSFSAGAEVTTTSRNSAIFFHPDGMGLNTWSAVRLFKVGPAGRLHWDTLPAMAVYIGTMQDALAATSHGGATTHAFGVKVPADSFGMRGAVPLRAANDQPYSLMREAQQRGKRTALVQSGDIIEPGTAAFVASVPARSQYEEIAAQVMRSGVDIILAGGEQWLLPLGTTGHHGPGKRSDGRNLIEEARQAGYTIVYTAEALAKVPATTERLLGVFASGHTFNDMSEQELHEKSLPFYQPSAPTIGEMSAAALKLLESSPQGFFMVVEEEGTDNFANKANALGTLTAGSRADDAIAILHRYVQMHSDAFMIMTSDSDAGGLQVVSPRVWSHFPADTPLPAYDKNGAPYDGPKGTSSPPFVTADGLTYAISWASADDVAGGILVRAAGRHADVVSRSGLVDNTQIYDLLHTALFE